MFELYTLFLFPLYMFPNFLAKYKEIKEYSKRLHSSVCHMVLNLH